MNTNNLPATYNESCKLYTLGKSEYQQKQMKNKFVRSTFVRSFVRDPLYDIPFKEML